MQIYTRTGDHGTTRIIGGKSVYKNSAQVEAYGTTLVPNVGGTPSHGAGPLQSIARTHSLSMLHLRVAVRVLFGVLMRRSTSSIMAAGLTSSTVHSLKMVRRLGDLLPSSSWLM